MKIVNLTQHPATPAQVQDNVQYRSAAMQDTIQGLLTFSSPPDESQLLQRAKDLARLALKMGAKPGRDQAMIGGAPYLMGPLEEALAQRGIQAVYAFSVRITEEVVEGSAVNKTSRFVHSGWVLGAVPRMMKFAEAG